MTLSNTMVALIWISVAVFAIHNVEEAMQVEAWASVYLPANMAKLYQTDKFGLASATLWVLYLAIVISVLRAPTSRAKLVFLIGSSALLANGFFHLVLSLVLQEAVPGFFSALFLVIPVSSAIIVLALRTGWVAPRMMAILFSVGVAAQVPIAAGTLQMSNFLM